MSPSLNWRVSPGVSCFHAAYQVHVGRKLLAESLEDALRRPVEDLNREIGEEHLSHAQFWRHLIPLAAEFATPRQLAEVVLTKLLGRAEAQKRIPRFQTHLAGMHAPFVKHPLSKPASFEPLQKAWNLQGP